MATLRYIWRWTTSHWQILLIQRMEDCHQLWGYGTRSES
uniref:Uncharacterized protein n=1 Tax=Arundo donax TaxID=35708 RepID=A0A0A9BN36_ARUDO